MVKVVSRREEYSKATRQALIDAAAHIFAEQGYAQTSLDEIAAAARVSKGALYHHFDGKQAVLEEAMDQLELAVHDRILDAAAHHPDDLWAGVEAALDVFLDACCEPIYGRLCFVEGPVGLGWSRWRSFEDKYAYKLTEGMLRGLIDAGVVDAVPVESATRVAVGILSHAGMALAEAPTSEQPRLKADLAAVIDRLFGGLRVTTRAASASRRAAKRSNSTRRSGR